MRLSYAIYSTFRAHPDILVIGFPEYTVLERTHILRKEGGTTRKGRTERLQYCGG